MKRGSSSSGSRSRSRREQQMLATKMLLMMLLHQVLAMITHRNETLKAASASAHQSYPRPALGRGRQDLAQLWFGTQHQTAAPMCAPTKALSSPGTGGI